jgi:hypothetical protein
VTEADLPRRVLPVTFAIGAAVLQGSRHAVHLAVKRFICLSGNNACNTAHRAAKVNSPAN